MTNVAHFPLLSLILFLPLAGAVLLLFIPNENGNAIRWVANLFALAGFLVSLPLWYGLALAVALALSLTVAEFPPTG